MPPTFCQDDARDFFKIDKKIIEGEVAANLQRGRGCCQKNFIYAPTLITLATPLYRRGLLPRNLNIIAIQ